jgi:hypothetical protein
MEMNINDVMNGYDIVGRAQFKYTVPEYAPKNKKSRNHAEEVVSSPVDIQTENSGISDKALQRLKTLQ